MMDTPEHLGGHHGKTNVDKSVLEFLKHRFKVESMLDVGCGPGGMLDVADELSILAYGVEGDSACDRKNIIHHDFTEGTPLNLPSDVYDLVWCVEFVEHVDPRFMGNFLCAFMRGKVLFLSHALPGQGGHHHVNEQDSIYWINVLRQVGFSHDAVLSLTLREIATNQYTKASGMFFTNERFT